MSSGDSKTEQLQASGGPQNSSDAQHTSSAGLIDGAYYDVVIVGAGISGIGAAYYLSKQCPTKRFVVLDTLGACGGTWLTHRYPGIRTDSDRYTYGFSFKPWRGEPVATGAEILEYLKEVVEENRLEDFIQYRHRVDAAEWSSKDSAWTLEVTDLGHNRPVRIRTNFLHMCQGFYRHDKGYSPSWPGMNSFKGRIVHPQNWPDDLEYEGKNVVIIGSGATAASLVPAMADKCRSLTMLQRSPTYYHPGHYAFDTEKSLRELGVGDQIVHEVVRRTILHKTACFNSRTFQEPDVVQEELLRDVQELLGERIDVKKHFTPQYRPWQQRLAFVPNGDTLRAFRDGKATIVTDLIERFTDRGLLLKSGDTLDADVVITATGFELSMMGNLRFTVDGKVLKFADTITYRSMLFTGLPNLAWVFGYFRSAWTPRSELVSMFMCDVLNHMSAKGWRKMVLRSPTEDGIRAVPWITEDNLSSGYLGRGKHLLPKQADDANWYQEAEFIEEEGQFHRLKPDDPVFVYS